MRLPMVPILPVLAGVLLLTGCGSAPRVVQVAPPAVRGEVRPPRPGKHYVWVPGRWTWRGADYVWAPGVWVKSKPGKEWVPGHWKRTEEGWVWKNGRWKAPA